VQAIRELDQDYPRVLCDREKELAIVLDLPFLRRVERQMTDLRQTIDDLGDLFAKLRFDIVDGNTGVFDDVVDQAAGNRS